LDLSSGLGELCVLVKLWGFIWVIISFSFARMKFWEVEEGIFSWVYSV